MYRCCKYRSTRLRRPLRAFSSQAKVLDDIQLIVKSSFNKMKGTFLETFAKRLPEKDKEVLLGFWLPKWDENPSQEEKVQALPADAVPIPAEIEMPSHPVFGKLLADLHFKRVYVTSVGKLSQAPVWEKQRILRAERINKIVNSKVKDPSGRLFPGAITMFEDVVTGQMGIVDGQHRAGALLQLAAKGYLNVNDYAVSVHVFPTKGDADISSLFREINSAEPVLLIDMPQEDGETESEDVRIIINEATEVLVSRYPEMFKPSSRCRPPHVHADTLRDNLFQSTFLTKLKINSADCLVKAIEGVNKKMMNSYVKTAAEGKASESDGARSKVSKQAYKKALENKFFLGVGDKSWMHI